MNFQTFSDKFFDQINEIESSGGKTLPVTRMRSRKVSVENLEVDLNTFKIVISYQLSKIFISGRKWYKADSNGQFLRDKNNKLIPANVTWNEIFQIFFDHASINETASGSDNGRDRFKDLNKGEGHIKYALCCYYWLHTFNEDIGKGKYPFRKNAHEIDKIFFGETLEIEAPSSQSEAMKPQKDNNDKVSFNDTALAIRKTSIQESELLSALINKPFYLDTPNTVAASGNDISLNPLNHSDIPLQGRKEEISKLDNFLSSSAPFEILFIIAPSGAGKTRLITEWHRKYVDDALWQSGFIEGSEGLEKWKDWQSETLSCDTLIIVDYIYRFKDIIRLITQKGASHAQSSIDQKTGEYHTDVPKLRLIMLDHTLPENSSYEEMDIHQKQATVGLAKSYAHPHSPIYLGKATPEDHENMIKGIIANVSDFAIDSYEVKLAYETLQQIDKKGENNDEVVKFANYPLFAILIAKKLAELGKNNDMQSLISWQRSDLINFYFNDLKQRRIPWEDNEEFGIWVGVAISAATILQSINYEVLFSILNHTNIHLVFEKTLSSGQKTLPTSDFEEAIVKSTCNHIVSSIDNHTLVRYQPDILGETFVLSFVHDYKNDFEQQIGVAILISKILCNHGQEKDGVPSHHQGLIEFSLRATRNLCNDNLTNEKVRKSLTALSLLLSPKNYLASESIFLSVSNASMSIVRLIKRDFNDKLESMEWFLDSLFEAMDINKLFSIFDQHRLKISNELDEWVSTIVTLIDWHISKSKLSKQLENKLEKFLQAIEVVFVGLARTRIYLPSFCNAPMLLNWMMKKTILILIIKIFGNLLHL